MRQISPERPGPPVAHEGARVWVVRLLGIATTSVKEKLAYRFDFLLSLVVSLIGMVLLVALWRAIYANATSLNYTLTGLLTYICLGQAFNFGRITWAQRRVLYRVNGNLQSGNIVFDLLRPIDYQALQFAEAIGQFVTELVLINTPAYLFALLVFGIAPPASPLAGIGFAVSLVGAFLVAFSLDFLLMIAAFWTFGSIGLVYARRAIIDVLAGSIIPLTLFPDWLHRIALALPFPALAYTPITIYLGQTSGAAIWWSILGQFGWALALVLLTRLVWLRAVRKLTIQGG